MKSRKQLIMTVMAIALFAASTSAQESGMDDIMALDEGDMNSILDELIGSMEGDTAPAPVMEAQPEPTAPPEESFVAEQPPAPTEETPAMEAPAQSMADSNEFGMGADDIGSMGAAPVGAATASADDQPLPEGFEPIGEVPEGQAQNEFGMGADNINDMGTTSMAEGQAEVAAPQTIPEGFEPIEEAPSDSMASEFDMGADNLGGMEASGPDTMTSPPADSAADTFAPSATEPAPESLLEGGETAEMVPDRTEPEPNYAAPVYDAAPPVAEEMAMEPYASAEDTSLAASSYEAPVSQPAETGLVDQGFGASNQTASMAAPPMSAPMKVEEKLPSAAEIRTRSVAIGREEDNQLMITVGDKVYLPIPTFKTPQVRDAYTIFKGSKKRIFRNQPEGYWYKKIGKLKVIEVTNLYVLGVVMAANDVIEKGDVVYINP